MMKKTRRTQSIFSLLVVHIVLFSRDGFAQHLARDHDHREVVAHRRRLSSKGKTTKKSSNRSPMTPSTKRSSSGSCLDQFSAVFLQFSAAPPAIYNDPNNRNAQEVGTRYVYNDDLRFLPTLDSVPGSRASGICTRTRSRIGNAQIGLQAGMGHCQFTYKLLHGGREMIFTASGEVSDSSGGSLPITGGAESASGAYGEVRLEPTTVASDGSITSNDGDFFLDANFYKVEALLTIPCN